MQRLTVPIACACLAFAWPISQAAADAPKAEAKSEHKLVGTWKLVSAKFGGQVLEFPEGYITMKHITPTHFMWASYGPDGKVTRAAGGTQTLKDDVYAETPEYGFSQDFDAIKGRTHSFKCKVEGNKWHHDGTLDNGLTIEEVWERVEKK